MKITAALMLKAPRPGTVKTRLAAEIGVDRATAVYRQLVEHQIRQIPSAWKIAIHYAPKEAENEMRDWLCEGLPEDAEFHPQPEGDLGARMSAAVQTGLDRDSECVALIGGDCPYLTCDYLQDAATAAETTDVTIGPALDGGYVLLMIKGAHACLFTGIPWSTSEVFPQTLSACATQGLSHQTLPTLEDIDDQASLLRAGLK